MSTEDQIGLNTVFAIQKRIKRQDRCERQCYEEREEFHSILRRWLSVIGYWLMVSKSYIGILEKLVYRNHEPLTLYTKQYT